MEARRGTCLLAGLSLLMIHDPAVRRADDPAHIALGVPYRARDALHAPGLTEEREDPLSPRGCSGLSAREGPAHPSARGRHIRLPGTRWIPTDLHQAMGD